MCEPEGSVNDGPPEDAVSRDELLDNVMLYWLNNAAASSARLYWESVAELAEGLPTVSVPAGISQFKREILVASRRWAESVYTDIRYWIQLDRGGHFAALEEPDLFVDEIRASFRHAR